MKFTVQGYVKIKAKLLHVENKHAVKFSIIDTGPGISKPD